MSPRCAPSGSPRCATAWRACLPTTFTSQASNGGQECAERWGLGLVAPPHEAEAAPQGGRERPHRERARAHLVSHRHGRAHRDAEAGAHQLLDGLLVAQLHHAPRPRLGGRAHRHQRVEQERRHLELTAGDRQGHEGHVQLVGGDGGRDLGGVARHHDELELRIARPHPPQERRQQVDAGGGAGAEPQPPRHHAPELAERLLRGLELREGASGVLQQHRPRRGGEGALAHPLEQRGAAAGLELTHVQAHRGLAQVQALRRAREAPMACNLSESPHVGGIEVHDPEVFLIVGMRTIYFPYRGRAGRLRGKEQSSWGTSRYAPRRRTTPRLSAGSTTRASRTASPRSRPSYAPRRSGGSGWRRAACVIRWSSRSPTVRSSGGAASTRSTRAPPTTTWWTSRSTSSGPGGAAEWGRRSCRICWDSRARSGIRRWCWPPFPTTTPASRSTGASASLRSASTTSRASSMAAGWTS